LDKLPDFLKAFSPKGADLSKASEKKGTPHTLVVSAAALRAADVVRYAQWIVSMAHQSTHTFIGADSWMIQGASRIPDEGSNCRKIVCQAYQVGGSEAVP
jgi:hypothetical protein